jgi:RNA polymerase sigma factor (sigma-70 family)
MDPADSVDQQIPSSVDEVFYEEFLAPMQDRMLRMIWRVVRDPDHARDTLQDALTVLWKKREVVRTHPNPSALIIKVCLNAAYDCLRRRHRRQRFETELDAAPQPPADPAPAGPASDVITDEEIRQAVGRLAPKQATALLLRVFEEQPYGAIAAAMGCSPATVRIHVMRARLHLRRWLAQPPRPQRRTGDVS